MKLGKKALLFNIMVVIMTIFILTSVLIIGNNLGKRFYGDKEKPVAIGERQFELIDVYSSGENFLLYTDIAAKYAAYGAIMEAAEKGGNAECIDEAGIYFWKRKDEECYPSSDSAKQIMKKSIAEGLSSYLSKYPFTEGSEYDKKSDYTIEISQGETMLVRGTTTSVYRNVLKHIGSTIKYEVKPNFEAEIDYDIRVYDNLKQNAEGLIDACKGKSKSRCSIEVDNYCPEGFECEFYVGEGEERLMYTLIDGFLELNNADDEECIGWIIFPKHSELADKTFELSLTSQANNLVIKGDGQLGLQGMEVPGYAFKISENTEAGFIVEPRILPLSEDKIELAVEYDSKGETESVSVGYNYNNDEITQTSKADRVWVYKNGDQIAIGEWNMPLEVSGKTFKFCSSNVQFVRVAAKQNKQFLVYDEGTKQVEWKSPEIKFGLYTG